MIHEESQIKGFDNNSNRPDTMFKDYRPHDEKKEKLLDQLFDSIVRVNEYSVRDSRLSDPRETKNISNMLY